MRFRKIGPTLPGAGILAAIVVFWLSLSVGASTQENEYPLTVGVATCESMPQRPGILGQNCTMIPDATVEVRSSPLEDANSETIGTCVTNAAGDATCDVLVPFDQALYVYVSANDQTTSLAGYAPLPSAYPLYVPSTARGVEPYPAQYIIFLPAQQEAGATPSAEQPVDEMSLSITFYTCQSNLSAATIPRGCAPASEGFSFEVVSLEGVAPPADQDDATLVGDVYVFDDSTLINRDLYRNLAISIMRLPEGYSDYLATGKGITCDTRFDFIKFSLPRGGPPVAVSIYAFPPLAATPVDAATNPPAPTPISIKSTPVGDSDAVGDGKTACVGTLGS